MVQQHNNDDNNNYNTRGNKLVTEVRLGDEDRKPSTDVDGLAVVANDHLLHRGCVRGVVLEDQGAELGQGKDPASDLQCRDACDAVDVREVGQDASGEYLSRQASCLRHHCKTRPTGASCTQAALSPGLLLLRATRA